MNHFQHRDGDRPSAAKVRPETLISLLRNQTHSEGDRVAFTFLGEREDENDMLTVADLDRSARHIGAILQSMGAQGSRAIILLEPGLEFISTLFGCFYAGVVAVPARPPTNDTEFSQLDSLLTDAGARYLLTSSSARAAVARRLAGSGIVVIAPATGGPGRADEWGEPLLDGGSLALLQYSQGPGGSLRGVMLSHQNLLHNAEVSLQACTVTRRDRMLTWEAPYHEMGLSIGILLPLYARCLGLLMAPQSILREPGRWLGAVGRHRVTITAAPGFAYELCTRRVVRDSDADLRLDSLRIALAGNDVVHPGALDSFREAFAPFGLDPSSLSPFWGIPEATLLVAVSSGDRPRAGSFDPHALRAGIAEVAPHGTGRRITNCGRPHPGQMVRIVDPHSTVELDDGEVGEIWVGGPSVSRGYWRRRAETMDSFGAFIRNTGEGPFFRSGHLGFVLGGGLHIIGDAEDDASAPSSSDLSDISADPSAPLEEL